MVNEGESAEKDAELERVEEQDPELAAELVEWRQKVAAHEPVELDLHWPIQAGSQRIERLTMRPAAAGHMEHFPVDRKEIRQSHYLQAIANSCGLALPIVRLMAAEDATRATMVVELFWRGSQRTKRKSSVGSPSRLGSPGPSS